jgi:hypothetical protein
VLQARRRKRTDEKLFCRKDFCGTCIRYSPYNKKTLSVRHAFKVSEITVLLRSVSRAGGDSPPGSVVFLAEF